MSVNFLFTIKNMGISVSFTILPGITNKDNVLFTPVKSSIITKKEWVALNEVMIVYDRNNPKMVVRHVCRYTLSSNLFCLLTLFSPILSTINL